MNERVALLMFRLDQRRYALALSSVERVVFIVDITPVPKAPPTILGVVNVGGTIVPVYDLRFRFGLPQRAISLTDNLIIIQTGRQKAALVADEVNGVLEVSSGKIVAPENVLPELEHVKGIVKLQDGLVIIQDLDQFLTLEEEKFLDEALMQFEAFNDERNF